MSRLEKKCLIVSAALHLLLMLVLFVGPAFLLSKDRANDLPVIDVIPSKLVDDLLFGGGSPKAAPPPSQTVENKLPAPVQPTALPPPPEPAAPAPQPEPPATKAKPAEKVERAPKPKLPTDTPQPPKTSEPDPDPAKAKPAPKRIQVDLTVKQSPKTAAAAKARAEAAAKAQQTAAAARRDQLAASIQNLRSNLSSGTSIEMPGPGGEAYANYGQAVKSVYENAWIPPASVTNENKTVQVKVIIARDGTVLSGEILRRSGLAPLDRSVERVLKQINFVAPFPEGARDDQRTFIIDFNLRDKRLLG
ncbi:MAG: TonB family protein [Chloroflexi bacterium]|nr:TonB family protein [Chloroflexota bacterium]